MKKYLIFISLIVFLTPLCLAQKTKNKKPNPTPTPKIEFKCPAGTHLAYKDYRKNPWVCEKNK